VSQVLGAVPQRPPNTNILHAGRVNMRPRNRSQRDISREGRGGQSRVQAVVNVNIEVVGHQQQCDAPIR